MIDFEKFISNGGTYPIITGKCEFCGKRKKVCSTSFVSNYCKECHEINIEESQKAVKALRTNLRH